MDTNWKLIRQMVNAAIDTCERIEASGYQPSDRDATINMNGQLVSVQDFLTSAWTAPENLRYSLIRLRHDTGENTPYVPETARIILSMTQAAVELIGAGNMDDPATVEVQKVVALINDHVADGIERATAARRAPQHEKGKTE